MANTLSLGSGNWGAKESLLLGYYENGKKFFPETFDVTRATGGTRVNKNGLIETPTEIGSELITNGDFSNGSTDWSLDSGWSVVDSKLYSDNSQTGYNSARQNGVTEIGKTYRAKFTLNLDSGVVQVKGSAVYKNYSPSDNGEVTLIFTADSTQFRFTNFPNNTLGTVDNVSVKEYNDKNLARIDYLDDAKGALLTEPQSTNLIPYSEDFSVSKWSQVNATTSSEAIITPNGTSGSFLVSPSADNKRHYIWESGAGSVTASFSLFVKAKELSYVQIASGNNTQQFANFDVSNGTVGSVGTNFSNAKIEDYGNGWYRCSAVSNSQYNHFYISVIQSSTSAWLGVWNPANNTDGLYVWGAQEEAANAVGYNGEYSTSYIPTDGSTVTRNKDEVFYVGDVNSFGSEGVLYAEIAALANDGTNRIFGISNNNNFNESIVLRYSSVSNRISAQVRKGGAYEFTMSYELTDTTDFSKIAFKYKENDFALWVDGVEAATSLSGDVITGLNSFSFSFVGGNLFYGKTKNVQVFNEALSDSDLLSLTTTGSVPYWKQYSAMATSLNYTNK